MHSLTKNHGKVSSNSLYKSLLAFFSVSLEHSDVTILPSLYINDKNLHGQEIMPGNDIA